MMVPLQTPYVPRLRALPCELHFYDWIRTDRIVLTDADPEHVARAHVRRWIRTGKVHVHPEIREHAARARTLALCLLRRCKAQHAVIVHGVSRLLYPDISATATMQVHLRAGVGSRRNDFSVPPPLKRARTTGLLPAGKYDPNTWEDVHHCTLEEQTRLLNAEKAAQAQARSLRQHTQTRSEAVNLVEAVAASAPPPPAVAPVDINTVARLLAACGYLATVELLCLGSLEAANEQYPPAHKMRR